MRLQALKSITIFINLDFRFQRLFVWWCERKNGKGEREREREREIERERGREG